jgi:hypothetical protein
MRNIGRSTNKIAPRFLANLPHNGDMPANMTNQRRV